MKVDPLKTLRGVQEIADALGFTHGLTLKLIRQGDLPGRRIGGRNAKCFTTTTDALSEYFKVKEGSQK